MSLAATTNTSKPLKVVEIPIRLIDEGKYSVRKNYDQEKIGELATSIKKTGTLQPVILKPMPNQRYHLVVGSRRLRASKRAYKETIPAMIVSGLEDVDAIIMALSENLQREDLTPFEEGWAILKLMKDHKMEAQDVAKAISKDMGFIDSRLKLLAAPREIQEMFADQRISLVHIVTLASVVSPADQIEYAKQVIEHRLTVKELTTLLKEKKARKFQDRAEHLLINSKKVRLRIKEFDHYLQATLPELKGIAYGETINLREALRGLKVTVEKAMKTFAD